MGDISDYYINQQIERHLKMSMAEDFDGYEPSDDEEDESIFKEYIKGTLMWTTKTGERLFVSQMSESHIRNTMRMPTLKNKENWQIIFNYELEKRGLKL